MVWTAGWRLAVAVSNAGGLGLIGSGSMYPEVLWTHIRRCRAATTAPFGVNLPLVYPEPGKHVRVILEEGVKIVFTSAGDLAGWTPVFREHGVTVAHVVSSARFAVKAERAGCALVVAEGFEAGGHNGREETTTMCLVPLVARAVSIPVVAAGGVADGRAMMAAFALGAGGVQVGSRFVATEESSCDLRFKQAVLDAGEGDTQLSLKALMGVRLLKNDFYDQVIEAESRCAGKEALKALLGTGRAKRGMFEGDLRQGELEIGQVSALITDLKPAGEVVEDIWREFNRTRQMIAGWTD